MHFIYKKKKKIKIVQVDKCMHHPIICFIYTAQSRIPYSLTKADGKTLQGFAQIFHGIVSHLQTCPSVCLHSEINTGHPYLTVKGLNVLRQKETRNLRNNTVSGNVRRKYF